MSNLYFQLTDFDDYDEFHDEHEVLGMPTDKNIFIQPYWKDGKYYHAIYNTSIHKETVHIIHENKIKNYEVKPFSYIMIEFNGNIYIDPIINIGLNKKTWPILLSQYLDDKNIESKYKNGIWTSDGLNGIGDVLGGVWLFQEKLTFIAGERVILKLNVPEFVMKIFEPIRKEKNDVEILKIESSKGYANKKNGVIFLKRKQDELPYELDIEVKIPDMIENKLFSKLNLIFKTENASIPFVRSFHTKL